MTWIRVPKPTFDLWGVILASIELTVLFIAVALALGVILGVLFIRRGRRGSDGAWSPSPPLSLHPEGRRP